MKAKQEELDRLAELRVYETLESSDLRRAGSCTTERTESERHSSQESSKAMKRCMVASRRAQLRAQDASSTI